MLKTSHAQHLTSWVESQKKLCAFFCLSLPRYSKPRRMWQWCCALGVQDVDSPGKGSDGKQKRQNATSSLPLRNQLQQVHQPQPAQESQVTQTACRLWQEKLLVPAVVLDRSSNQATLHHLNSHPPPRAAASQEPCSSAACSHVWHSTA